jgi:hypothetical protein
MHARPVLGVLGALAIAGCPSSSTPPGGQSARVTSVDRSPPPKTAFAAADECKPSGKGRDFEVGPGKKLESLGAVPLETLGPGDTVRIHHRPEPYREKLMISGVGTADAPIRVCGIKGPGGELPVIDGKDATTRSALVFPYEGHQRRGLIIVGWKNSDPWKLTPEYIVIESLEIANASPPYQFTDRAGAKVGYVENAAGIFVQRGRHIVLRGNVVHDNGNGLFVGTAGAEELTEDVKIERNYVYNNGSDQNYYHHNVYNEASGVVYEFNHFGPPKAGPQGILGANIKERSAGVVIRYNWIEDGAHLIDLVDAEEALNPNLQQPSFRESWVYGNVLVRGPQPSGSLVHYGGDSGMPERYRKGTLHFFHNTVVVENWQYKDYDKAAIFELSTNDERLDARNNILFSGPTTTNRPVVLLGPRDRVVSGRASFAGDWISDGITLLEPNNSYNVVAEALGLDAALRSAELPFVATDKRDFRLPPGCPFRGKGSVLDYPAEHAVRMQYVAFGKGEPRPSEAAPTPGAFAAP